MVTLKNQLDLISVWLTLRRMNALHEYLKAERGRANALAAELRISPSAISQWQRVPAERALEIERLTGIPRHDLRPDLYPAPAQESAA